MDIRSERVNSRDQKCVGWVQNMSGIRNLEGWFWTAGKRGDEVRLDLPFNAKRGAKAGSVSNISFYDTSNSSLMIITA